MIRFGSPQYDAIDMPRPARQWLRRSSVRTTNDDVYSALRGASYHLWHIGKLTEELGLATQDQVDRFHWHLRAFFWELVAVQDVLERDPQWKVAAKKLKAFDWFQEVNEYRNLAHQSFHVVEAMRPSKGGKILAFMLQPARRGQQSTEGRVQLPHYWQAMRDFVRDLLPPEAAKSP